jgi:hypothetical protein
MEQTVRAPTGLGVRGRALWTAVVAKYQLTPTELELLHEMCSATDELRKLAIAAKQASAVIPGSRHQKVVHPIFATLVTHRESIRRLARQIGLPDDHVNVKPKVLKSKHGVPTALRSRTTRVAGDAPDS